MSQRIHHCSKAIDMGDVELFCGCGFFARCANCGRSDPDHLFLAQDDLARLPGYKCLFGARYWQRNARCEFEVRHA